MTNDILSTRAKRISERYPTIWQAYQQLGKACTEVGPLDSRTQRLTKLALAIALGSEGAVHSHVRRALDEGVTADELLHVALLSIPTIGFSKGIAALTWIEDVVNK